MNITAPPPSHTKAVERRHRGVARGHRRSSGYKGFFGVADFNGSVADVDRISDLMGSNLLSFRGATTFGSAGRARLLLLGRLERAGHRAGDQRVRQARGGHPSADAGDNRLDQRALCRVPARAIREDRPARTSPASSRTGRTEPTPPLRCSTRSRRSQRTSGTWSLAHSSPSIATGTSGSEVGFLGSQDLATRRHRVQVRPLTGDGRVARFGLLDPDSPRMRFRRGPGRGGSGASGRWRPGARL